MAQVILGLLMLQPQSLYALKKSFEAGVSLFYSASTGSIKRAVDSLLADGHIGVESSGGPRGKRTYTVTDAGRHEFRRWMLEDLKGSDLDSAMLSRVFFLGLLDPPERPAVTARVSTRIRADLETLQRLERRSAEQGAPEGFEDVATYQQAVLQYGLQAHMHALRWAEDELP